GVLRSACVEKQQRMKVPGAGVENVADEQAVLLAHSADEFQHLRQPRARDHAVLYVVIRANAAERAEGVLPAAPEQLALFVRPRAADLTRVVMAANHLDCVG